MRQYGRSERTIKMYGYVLQKFREQLDQDEKIEDIGEKDILSFMDGLKEKGISDATRRFWLMVLRSFYNFCEKEYKIPNIIRSMRNFSFEKKEPEIKFLTKTELGRLIGAIARNGKNNFLEARDACLIKMMTYTGMRVSEITGLNLSDINLEENTVKVRGKGNKERIVYINTAKLLPDIRRWIREREEYAIDDTFFINKEGGRITNMTAERRVAKYAKDAHLTKTGISPHSLRHTFAKMCLEADPTALPELRDSLGHENIRTTSRYLQSDQKKRRQLIEKLSLTEEE